MGQAFVPLKIALVCAGVRFFSLMVMTLLLVAATTARATVSVALSLTQLTRTSRIVARGHIVDVQCRLGSPTDPRDIVTEVTLIADATIVGQPARAYRFLVHGGRVGSRAVVVPGEASFRAGEEVVVFLMESRGDVLWLNALAQGKWSVVRDDAGVPWAGSSASRADLVSRQGTAPPAAAMRLTDLESQIRAAATGHAR